MCRLTCWRYVLMVARSRPPASACVGRPLASLRNGDALRGCHMHALANVLANLVMTSIGFLLFLECLDVTLAGLVSVIDDPGLPRLPSRLPSALADRHWEPPLQQLAVCCIMLQSYLLVNREGGLAPVSAGRAPVTGFRGLSGVSGAGRRKGRQRASVWLGCFLSIQRMQPEEEAPAKVDRAGAPLSQIRRGSQPQGKD